jgi:hypothetical protein
MAIDLKQRLLRPHWLPSQCQQPFQHSCDGAKGDLAHSLMRSNFAMVPAFEKRTADTFAASGRSKKPDATFLV